MSASPRRRAAAGEIEHLAAGHAAEAGGRGKARDQLGAHRRVGVGGRVGENGEGQRQQRVAGEDRGRLVEGPVHGRPPAPEVVVVHRRQVVMDEAVAVDAFQRRRGAERIVGGAAEEAGRFDEDEGAEPLAAAERGMAHGGKQPRRAARSRRQAARRRAASSSTASVASCAAFSRVVNSSPMGSTNWSESGGGSRLERANWQRGRLHAAWRAGLFRTGGEETEEQAEDIGRRSATPRPACRGGWSGASSLVLVLIPLVLTPRLQGGQPGLDADDLGAPHRRPDRARLGLLRRHVEMDGRLGRRRRRTAAIASIGASTGRRSARSSIRPARPTSRAAPRPSPCRRPGTCSCGPRAPMCARRWKSRWRSMPISSSASGG